MPDSPRPSYEELAALVVSQAALIESLTARVAEQDERIARQDARIAELERQLGRNSKNSSMPPSSDRFSGKGKRPSRGSGRKPGKQPGAPGAGLEMSIDPDEIVDHVPAACGGCGADLTDPAVGATGAGYARRQVHDLPEPVAAHVREHRLHRMRCACGHTTRVRYLSRRLRRVARRRWDILAVIAAGGAVGSLARWGLTQLLPHATDTFPWATFTANVSGCLLLGVLMVFVIEVWPPSRYVRPFLGVGVLGGYTTFSSYMLDARTLLVSETGANRGRAPEGARTSVILR